MPVIRQSLPDVRVLRAVLATLLREHGVPGGQLAVRHRDETVHAEAGVLEHGSGRAVAAHHAFPVGSITKAFTATAAMALVADDDLNLDAPVGAYLSGLPDPGPRLTLRRLFSHTGGLACYPASPEVVEGPLGRYLADACDEENQVLPPGAAFSYSNVGYVLAGAAITGVTGMSWAEAVSSIVLTPLGITPSFVDSCGLGPAPRPVATGHAVNPVLRRARPVRQSLRATEAPAGGLAASALDLVALGSLHIGEGVPRILPREAAERMRRPAPGARPHGLAEAWGLGLAAFPGAGQWWWGHDGNSDGTACYLRIDPHDDWVVGFTANATTGMDAWRGLIHALADEGVPLGRPADVAVPARPLPPPSGCAGTFVNGDLEYVVEARDDGQLYLSVDGDAFERMVFTDPLGFQLQELGTGARSIGGRVVRDSSGHVRGLQVGGRLARRAGLRVG